MVSEPEPTVPARSLRAAPSADKRPTWGGVRAFVHSHLGTIALLLPALIFAIPTLIALTRHFDGLYGQDPFAYYAYATGPLRAALLDAALPPPFYWPPGYPLLVTLASFVVGTRPLAGQLVSLLAALLVPLFTLLLAHETIAAGRGGSETRPLRVASGGTVATPRGRVSDPPLPLIAGLLIACCGQLWQSSVVVMSDTTGLAAATAGVWALLRYGRRHHGGWLLAAAALLAWAVLTRWAYALVALPCLAYACWLLIRAAPHERRRIVAHGGGAFLLACAILGPTLYAATATLRSATAPYASFAIDLQVYRWHPLNPFQRDFATADGRLSYPLPNGLYYATLLARPLYFTPLLAPLALLGLWRVLRRPTTPNLLLLAWLAIVLAFHAGAPWQNVRFVLACAPPCAILLAHGLAALWGHADRRLALAARALLTLGLAWMLVDGVQLLDNFIDRKDANLAVARALDLPPDARLLTFGLTLTLQHYTPYETHDLSTHDPATLAALLTDHRPTYLLLDLPNIEQQWPDRAPGVNYRWLRDHPGLTPLTQHAQYTLYQVTAPLSLIIGHTP